VIPAGSIPAMRTTSPNPRRAATAIAAVLALTAAPALAQDSTAPLDGPIVAAPQTVTAPDPAPVLVIPDVSTVEAEPAPADPVVAPGTTSTTRATAPQPAARTARPAASETAARATAVAASTAPVAPAVDEPLVPAEADAELPPVAPIDEPANIQPTPEQATDITAVLGLILIALVGLVVAVFVFAALRRRRAAIVHAEPAQHRAAMPRETAPRPVATVAEPAPLAEPVQAMDRAAPMRTLRTNGAAVPLPARLPESYEERSALLQRMIDAKPDRANPFTDRRARMRRARLILQSLGRKFDGTKPWIDLSDYLENWPELARQPQAASTPVRTRELEPA
jgi:hypothetical protein